MRKALLVLALIFGMTGLAQAQQKWTLSAAATTCTTSNTSCLIYQVDAASGGATFTVGANASGNTIQFEATGDGGATWVALNATPSNSTTAATSTTSTGTWQANVAGYTAVRMRMSTLVSGTATVSIITSLASARSGGGGGGGGVTSFSGDGTVITNSASTGAVTATIAGTSGGFPCFNSATSWQSTALISAGVLLKGGGAGACGAASSVTDNGTTVSTSETYVSSNATGFNASNSNGGYQINGALFLSSKGGTGNGANVAVGDGAGASYTLPENGVVIGHNACAASGSDHNTCVGYTAGDTGTQNATGNLLTLIGANTAVAAAADTNETVLGEATTGAGSNTGTIGNASVTDVFHGGATGLAYIDSAGFIDRGSTPTITGTGACGTVTTQSGGATAGTFKCTGITGASTATITFAKTAPSGWTCDVWDETTRADNPSQTSHSQTTCVVTAAAIAQNDVLVFKAFAW